MADMVQVTIDNKWEVIHGLSTGVFTFYLDHSKGRGQVEVMHISTINILEIVTDIEKINTDIKYQVVYGISIGILKFYLEII